MIIPARESFKADEILYLEKYDHPILGECIGYAHPFKTVEKNISRKLNGNKLHLYEADILIEKDVNNILASFNKNIPYIFDDLDENRIISLINIAHLATLSRFYVYFKTSFYTLADHFYTRAAVQMENNIWAKNNFNNYRLRKHIHLIEFGQIQPWFQ